MKKRKSISVSQAEDPGTSAKPLAATQKVKKLSHSEKITLLKNSVRIASDRRGFIERVIVMMNLHIEFLPISSEAREHLKQYKMWWQDDLVRADHDLQHCASTLAEFGTEQKATQKENNKKALKHK